MKKILIDATCILPKQSGVGRYAIELLRAMVALDQKRWALHILLHPDIRNMTDSPVGFLFAESRIKPEVSYLEVPGIGFKREWVFWRMRGQFPAHDLFHCLSSNAPWCMAKRGLVTIHDLKFILFPGFFGKVGRLKSLYLSKQFRAIARRYQRIITVSDSTRHDFLEVYGSEAKGLEKRVKAILSGYSVPGGSTSLPELKQQYGIDGPYFFYLGELRPHKNVRGMIDAFIAHKRANPDNDALFVIGGHAHPSFVADYVEDEAVRFIGFVREQDLGPLYKHSLACYFASLYEGFGFPILEAMASGTLVITSSISSMPEVAGDAAILVDPTDKSDMESALTRVKEMSEKEREAFIQKASLNLDRFSWKSCARQTFEQYNLLIGNLTK
ncbi:glycosyltransferase family 4 protein [Neolewinella aurantiaca]|uniref:Glycosyltransferase family 4 protein n=1 Tax=Neolewinella aurantiaca TaxID=2602767 RepID=A0A5C7FWZ0_9BACT|nr:glycosyltransferase family 1 protein [Neolewinella aurantiaca]TXF90960.1 glycosyltransferase family 4 protein [Neolewinella aurantiaca]